MVSLTTKNFRIGDNNLQFLSGGVENLVSLRELVLTRNRLGTLALITPLNVQPRVMKFGRRANFLIPKEGIIYFNQLTTETRRPPQGATVIAAQGYESDSEDGAVHCKQSKDKYPVCGSYQGQGLAEKLKKRAERLQLRDELAEQGKGIWEVEWTMFTGRAYYFNHFEKRRSDVMPRAR